MNKHTLLNLGHSLSRGFRSRRAKVAGLTGGGIALALVLIS